ncbi:hypothetical protein GQ600_12184 [Phytophthora cactorum]|nr:hypothetical protein GQ600_12184 [Phytophthora cactorum]
MFVTGSITSRQSPGTTDDRLEALSHSCCCAS